MAKENLRTSELDRELALSDSGSAGYTSSSSCFNDDTDIDPTFDPSLPSCSGIQRFVNSRANNSVGLVGLSDCDSDSSNSSRVRVQARPRPGQNRPTNQTGRRPRPTNQRGGRPRPTANRQVISDSETQSDVNPDDSDWDDVSESSPPTFQHGFDFFERPGPKHIPPATKEPVDFFKLFFTDFLVNIFATETNRYARQFLGRPNNISPTSRLNSWVPVTGSEILAFIVVIFNMGLNIKPTIKSYWSKNDSQYIPWFGKMFTRNRFENILTFLHMIDNDKFPKAGEPGYDPCQKFQPLIDYCNNSFQNFFTAHQQVSIDESLVGTKNQTSLMQYLPNKHHHRWGIKFWVMCDTLSKYCLKIFCYKGAKSQEDREEIKEFGLAYSVVKKLISACNYLQKGYHIFIDNFFTSIPLIKWLYSEKTFVTGTIRKNRIGLPNDYKKKFAVGEKLYKKKGNMITLAYREKKTQTKPVLLISSKSDVKSIPVTKRRRGRIATKETPAIIAEYNKYMGGIDAFDMMLYSYLDERRTVKYWKKVTFNFFSRMLLNSYILYQETCKKRSTKPLDRYQFIVSVIQTVGDDWMAQQRDHQARRPRQLHKLEGKKEKTCWVCSGKGGHSEIDRKRKRSRTVCSRCLEGCHYQCFAKHKCQ